MNIYWICKCCLVRWSPSHAASSPWSWWWPPPPPATGWWPRAGGRASSRGASRRARTCRCPSTWRRSPDARKPEESVSSFLFSPEQQCFRLCHQSMLRLLSRPHVTVEPLLNYLLSGYIRGCAALVVIGLLFDFFGTLLTGLGLRSTDPNKKYKYYRVAIYALVVACKLQQLMICVYLKSFKLVGKSKIKIKIGIELG